MFRRNRKVISKGRTESSEVKQARNWSCNCHDCRQKLRNCAKRKAMSGILVDFVLPVDAKVHARGCCVPHFVLFWHVVHYASVLYPLRFGSAGWKLAQAACYATGSLFLPVRGGGISPPPPGFATASLRQDQKVLETQGQLNKDLSNAPESRACHALTVTIDCLSPLTGCHH